MKHFASTIDVFPVVEFFRTVKNEFCGVSAYRGDQRVKISKDSDSKVYVRASKKIESEFKRLFILKFD